MSPCLRVPCLPSLHVVPAGWISGRVLCPALVRVTSGLGANASGNASIRPATARRLATANNLQRSEDCDLRNQASVESCRPRGTAFNQDALDLPFPALKTKEIGRCSVELSPPTDSLTPVDGDFLKDSTGASLNNSTSWESGDVIELHQAGSYQRTPSFPAGTIS